MQAFEEVEVKNVSAKPQKIRPKLNTRVRNLSSHNAPDIGVKKDTEAQKQETVFEQPLEELIKQTPEPVVETEPVVNPIVEEIAEEIIEEVIVKPEEKNPPELIQPMELVVPEEPEIPVATQDPDPAPTTIIQEQPILEDQVRSNKTLPFPDPPTQPNKIVGMVLTHDEKLVDRANIVIFDQNGNVIRSVKSNLLGQFFVTGTLPNGTFIIDTKKQGMEFTQQQLALSGQVVEPLEIRASA